LIFAFLEYTSNGMEDSYMDECLDNLISLREDFRWAGTSNQEIKDFTSPVCSFKDYVTHNLNTII
jgi:hypothetical protein